MKGRALAHRKKLPRKTGPAPRYNPDDLAEVLRLDRGQLRHELKQRFKASWTNEQWERGWLERTADRWACAMGLHPFLVWPKMLDDNIAELGQKAKRERPCEYQQCQVLHPRLDLAYCSKRCSNNAATERGREHRVG